MAASLLSPVSTARHMTPTACTSMPSTWSCDEAAKRAKSCASGRGHPSARLWEWLGNLWARGARLEEPLLEELPGQQASLRGCACLA